MPLECLSHKKRFVRNALCFVVLLSGTVLQCLLKKPSDIPTTGNISGKVTDAASGIALSGVGITTSPITISTTTNITGDYTIPDLSPGTFTIEAQKSGYADNAVTIVVLAGQTATANMAIAQVSPTMSVSPKVLNFGATSSVLQFDVTNATAAGILSWTITKQADATWLTMSVTGGQTTTTPSTVVASLNRTGLAPGNYSTKLTLTSNGGNDSVLILAVVPNPNAPQLSVSVASVDFGSVLSMLTFSINNTGTGALTYLITPDKTWLSASPSSGTINAETVTITATANRTGLPGGSSNLGNLAISSNGGSANVMATLQVPQDGALPAPTLQSANVTETGCTLDWTECTDSRYSNYKVYESANSGVTENNTLLATITNKATTTHTITGITGPSLRYYRVYVYSTSGSGSPSNEVAVNYPAALKGWTLTYTTPSGSYLKDVYSIDDNHGWAAGYKVVSTTMSGIILKWNGSSWVQENVPTNVEAVYAIHMLSNTEGYASGQTNDGACEILKYNGTSWSALSSKTFVSATASNDIFAFSQSLIFVTVGGKVFKVEGTVWTDQGASGKTLAFANQQRGYSSGGGGAAAYKFNGFGWSAMSFELHDVSLGSDGVLCGLNYNSGRGTDTLQVFQNDIPLASFGVSSGSIQANCVFALSTTDIWVGTVNGNLKHCDGANLKSVAVTGASTFRRIYLHSSGSGWGLADNGIYMYR